GKRAGRGWRAALRGGGRRARRRRRRGFRRFVTASGEEVCGRTPTCQHQRGDDAGHECRARPTRRLLERAEPLVGRSGTVVVGNRLTAVGIVLTTGIGHSCRPYPDARKARGKVARTCSAGGGA